MTVIELKVTIVRPEWLRKSQVLVKYNVGKDQLQRWREDGVVKISPLSKKNVLYRVSDIERTIDGFAEGRNPEPYKN